MSNNENNSIEKILEDFLGNREEMILEMMRIADELDEVHKNVNITKVVTGSTGIAGTILCISGLVLAIPTAGLSMFLTVGGGALAAASGTAHLGSDIAEHVIKRSRLEKFDELCQADEIHIGKLHDTLQEENEKLQNAVDKGTIALTTTSTIGEVASITNLTCSVVRITQATTLTVNTLRFIGVASVVFSAATLPIQIIDLAVNSHAVGKKKTSKTSVQLRELAGKLEAQATNVRHHFERITLSTETVSN